MLPDRLDGGISATCGSVLQLKHTDVYNSAIALVKVHKTCRSMCRLDR